jgi:hypothetical protein
MKELINFALRECRLTQFLDLELPEETLVGLLGGLMIEMAMKTLPEEAFELTEKWKNQNSEEQLEILQKLFYLFRSKKQIEIPATSEGIGLLLEFERKKNVEITYRNYLPCFFNQVEPNCLGREMQLSAFMDLANARHYSALIIRSLSEIDCRETLKFIQNIREDLKKRNIENDPAFEKSLEMQELAAKIRLNSEILFHAGIVTQLADKRWAMIDPYGVCWGKLPPEMQVEMEKADEFLTSHEGPVFKLIYTSEVEKEIAQKKKEAWEWVEKSKKLDSLKNLQLSFEQLVERLTELNVAEEIIESPTFESVRKDLNERFNDPRVKKNFIKLIVEPLFHRGIKVVIDELITLYHLIAISKFTRWFDNTREKGKIVHPAFEIMKSHYSVGIGVLNNLAVEFRKYSVIEELVKIAPTQFQIGSYLIVKKDTSSPFVEHLKQIKGPKHKIINDILNDISKRR